MIARRSLIGAAGLLAAQPLYAQAAAKPKVAISTSLGAIVLEMETGKAPITCRNFLRYVDNDYFTGGANIYRCMKTPGDPESGTVQGQPRYDKRRFPPVEHESTLKTGLKHDTGSISLARFAPGTATCDWFICLGPQPFFDAHPEEDKKDNMGYAVFGQVVQGLDIVRRIHAMPANGKAAFPELKGQILTHPVPILGAKRV